MLYLACREMWRQDVDRALRLAHSLPPDAAVGNRDEALAALAAGVAQSDPERALGIAADIHSEFNHGEFSREVALQAIITAMAHRNLSRALSLLPRVRDTERKVFFLLELAREKGGHAARHRQWLSLAAATARRLPDPADRVEWLTRIVTDAAPEPGIARPLLRQAYALALQRVNANGRDQALTAVAGLLMLPTERGQLASADSNDAWIQVASMPTARDH